MSALGATIEELARAALGSEFRLQSLRPVAGGDINTALCAEGSSGRVFVKLRPAAGLALFEREAESLQALAACPELRVPRVLASTARDGQALLLLEWLDLAPLREAAAGERAGHALAALHRIAGSRYGWDHDNFIGSTPQANPWHDSWPQFFAQHRLGAQLELAARNGHRGALQERGEQVRAKLGGLFLDYRPAPSLLHGDLWSGNIGVLGDGSPVLFDPASHYGDREADLAMTELFGGFPLRFYAAYREAWPLADGYETRKTLYNLYHVLNHLNLFGRGYLAQAERMLSQLQAQLSR